MQIERTKPLQNVLIYLFDDLLFAASGTQRWQRLIAGTLMGLILAQLSWYYVLANLGLPPIARYINCSVFAIGYPLVRRIRCYSVLILLGFFSRAGRSYMRAIVLGLILAGPVHNLSRNGRDVVRSFACSARLTYNLTRTRFELMTAPFRRSLRNLPDTVVRINRAFRRVDRVVRPLRTELQTNASVVNVTHSARQTNAVYRDRIRRRCWQQVERGRQRCEHAFRQTYRRCRRRLPAFVGRILCAPMRVRLVCSVAARWTQGRMREVCTPGRSVIADDLGDNYQELQNLLSRVQSVGVRVTHLKVNDLAAVRNQTTRTRRLISADFQRKWRAVRWYLWLVQKCLAVFFLQVVFNAVRYHRRYMSEISYDNCYRTNYLRHIEMQRGGTSILTSRTHRSHLLHTFSLRRNAAECWAMLANACAVLLELSVAVCLLLIDRLVTIGLGIVRRNAGIDYRQWGEHIVDVRVNGSGIVADMLRHSVATFNMHAHIESYADNARCLPHAHALSSRVWLAVFAMYACILLLVYLETNVRRLRHLVAAYFYFEQEKSRGLWLYNDALKRRRGWWRQLRERLRRQLRENDDGRWESGGCTWLCCRIKCVMCAEQFVKVCWWRSKSAVTFVECAICGASFCAECWLELRGVCLICELREELKIK